MSAPVPKGDELVRVLATLSNPHRLRVVAALTRGGRNYVSRLARELGISRALLQVHLKKLEAAGLVSSRLELSEDGKAMKYYEVRPFAVELTPRNVAIAVDTLGRDGDPPPEGDEPAGADSVPPGADRGGSEDSRTHGDRNAGDGTDRQDTEGQGVLS
ncbi:helix-turn-helix domain-containing protein [Streptomyces sp. NPDC051018]|uniref:ArsR/SmtB family transcription factor n=1 Tax=Streptomyces sp. NPDC051018 TaxID=3365639 RepID=UPI00379F2274